MATIEAPPRLQVRLHKGPFVNEPYVDFSKEENARQNARSDRESPRATGSGIRPDHRRKTCQDALTRSSRSILQNRRKSWDSQKAGKDHVEPAMKRRIESV